MKEGRCKEYLEWVRSLPCNICQAHPPSDAHHVTGAGLSMKASDYHTIPLCHSCHMAFHDLSGHFADWTKERRKQWQLNTATLYFQRRYDPDVF